MSAMVPAPMCACGGRYQASGSDHPVCPRCGSVYLARRQGSSSVLAFPGGEHVAEYPRRDLLLQSARDWMKLAAEHSAAAYAAIAAGDDTAAIIELGHAERKTEMARLAMIEARGVDMGTV